MTTLRPCALFFLGVLADLTVASVESVVLRELLQRIASSRGIRLAGTKFDNWFCADKSEQVLLICRTVAKYKADCYGQAVDKAAPSSRQKRAESKDLLEFDIPKVT